MQVPKESPGKWNKLLSVTLEPGVSGLSRVWDCDKRLELEVRGQSSSESEAFCFVFLASLCHSYKNVWKLNKSKYITEISDLAECLQGTTGPHPGIVVSLAPSRTLLTHQFLPSSSVWSQVSTGMFLVCLLGLALTLAWQCRAREVFVSET